MGKKFTYEEVSQYVEDRGEKLLSDEYINNRTKLKIMCSHGHIYNMTFKDFKNNHGCPTCASCKKYTYNEVKTYMYEFGYELLSNEYHNNQEKLSIKCPKGHITDISFSSFKNGRRCKICANNQRLDYDYVKKYVNEYGYILLDNTYKNNNTKMNMICPNNHHIQLSFKHFQRGVRCSKCSCSSGESEIMKILDDNHIFYIHQHTFDDCVDKQVLPFDFFIPDKCICIEYDGIQHFKPIDQFGGETAFQDRIKKDTIKNNYCENNNIKLIRIPYWDFFNLEEIITDQVVNI